jgi:hypothetical protein
MIISKFRERAAEQPSHLWANNVFLLCITAQNHSQAIFDVPAG